MTSRSAARARVGLVTALLPPTVGGTQVLVWRLFHGDPELAVISGSDDDRPPAAGALSALAAPTLHLPYPRLRGYRYGLGYALGAISSAWLVTAAARAIRFFRSLGVEHIVSIPHAGPFALVGLAAARYLGVAHTFYILDAWEEAATGPVELALIRRGLRLAARMPGSRLAVVSPRLGAHYQAAFGFRDVTWIPNPAPISQEQTAAPTPRPRPYALFTGVVKPFNIEILRNVVRGLSRCRVVERLILTGNAADFVQSLRTEGAGADRVEFQLCTPAEIAALQREAAVLLIATQPDDLSHTSLGYLPGRLPEYVATRRPILLIGPRDSDAARAIRHWRLGRTTTSADESELAGLLDLLAAQGADSDGAGGNRDQFLEVFSRAEARRRLLGDSPPPISPTAASLAAAFEQPFASGA